MKKAGGEMEIYNIWVTVGIGLILLFLFYLKWIFNAFGPIYLECDYLSFYKVHLLKKKSWFNFLYFGFKNSINHPRITFIAVHLLMMILSELLMISFAIFILISPNAISSLTVSIISFSFIAWLLIIFISSIIVFFSIGAKYKKKETLLSQNDLHHLYVEIEIEHPHFFE